MLIKYESKRITKQFFCLELDMYTEAWLDWRYYPESKEWRKIVVGEKLFKKNETYCTSSCHCRSLKAAIRRIKKWNFPKSTRFRLVSLRENSDIFITV